MVAGPGQYNDPDQVRTELQELESVYPAVLGSLPVVIFIYLPGYQFYYGIWGTKYSY